MIVFALLPGRAPVGGLIETGLTRRSKTWPQLRRAPRRVAAPPLGSKEPDMAHLERSGFERGRQKRVMRGEHFGDLGQGHRAVTDRAAHQAITLIRPLRLVIFGVHMAHQRRHASGEGYRLLAHRQRVARIQTDARSMPGLPAELDELPAREILMILDGERHAALFGLRSQFAERSPYLRDQLRPVRPFGPVASQHRRKTQPQGPGADRLSHAQGLADALKRRSQAHDRLHPERAQPPSERGKLRLAHSDQPCAVNLERARAEFGADVDQALQAPAVRISPGRPLSLKSQVICQAVRVQSGAQHPVQALRHPGAHGEPARPGSDSSPAGNP